METLPTDLIFLLTSFLDDKSKRIMRLANTQWFNSIRYDDFTFYHTTDKQLPLILDRLAKYSFPIGVSFKKRELSLASDTYRFLGTLTQLTKLYAYNKTAFVWRLTSHPLTNLTNLKLLGHNYPMEIMRHFTGLRKLYIPSFNAAQELDLTRFTKLESVEWDSSQDDISDPLIMLHHAKGLTCLHVTTCPIQMDENGLTKFTKLKDLSLEACERRIDIPHLPNLESLHVDAKGFGDLSSLQNTLTDLSLAYFESLDFLPSLQTLTCLKKFCLMWNPDILLPQDLHFLTAFTTLESLYLFPTDESNDWSKAMEFIKSDKLTNMIIRGSVDMQSFSTFATKLHRLDINSISGDFESIPNLDRLTRFASTGCTTNTLKLIESMTNLKSLNVTPRGLSATDKLPLANLTKLEEIEEYEPHPDQNPNPSIDSEHLKHLPLLKKLRCEATDDNFWENIGCVTSLKHLEVNKGQTLTDDSIRWLTGLTNLAKFTCYTPSEEFTGSTLTLLTSLHTLQIYYHLKDKFIYCKSSEKNGLRQTMTRLVHFDT